MDDEGDFSPYGATNRDEDEDELESPDQEETLAKAESKGGQGGSLRL